MINDIPTRIYSVEAGVVTVMVPYKIQGYIAKIQIINGGTESDTVTAFVGQTAPGVFTLPPGGIAYAAAQHTTDLSTITPSHPAQPCETIALYLTGLGAVSPAVNSGTAGPNPPATVTNQIAAYIGRQQATLSFAGLTPGWSDCIRSTSRFPRA